MKKKNQGIEEDLAYIEDGNIYSKNEKESSFFKLPYH